jgi:hypothetical protein
VELFDRIDHPRGVSLFTGHAGALHCSTGFRSPLSAGSVRGDACRSHHVQHTSREAEQEKHNKSEGRRRQQTVETPANYRTDKDAGDQLGRKPETARHRRSSGSPVSASGLVSPDFAAVAKFGQPLIETSEPCGKRSLIRRFIATSVSAALVRAFRHAVKTRLNAAY